AVAAAVIDSPRHVRSNSDFGLTHARPAARRAPRGAARGSLSARRSHGRFRARTRSVSACRMTPRLTPFALVFGELAPERFPEIERAVGTDAASARDRDRFVLLAPVGNLLRELAPDDAPPEAMEAYVRLVHHAYRHWAAGGVVFDTSEATVARAIASGRLSSRLPHSAFYLRLPALRVWGAARPDAPPEP